MLEFKGPLANSRFQWSLGFDIRFRARGCMGSECQIHSTGMESRRLLFYRCPCEKRRDAMKISDPLEIPIEQWRPGVETRMLVSAKNGAAQLCMFEQWVAPGTGAPTHSHPVEEVLTVREGEAEMWIGTEHVKVLAGQSLMIPARRLHGFRNSGTITLHIHAVLAAPHFEATPEG